MARIYAGFSPQRIGTISFSVTNTTSGSVVKSFTISRGEYERTGAALPIAFDTHFGHIDFSTTIPGTLGGYTYTAFADLLATIISASFGTTWTVEYSQENCAYTITAPLSVTSFNVSYTADSVFPHIMGFEGSSISNTGQSVVSTVRPYYVIVPETVGFSNSADMYEPAGISYDGEADDGSHYGTSRTEAPKYFDFEFAFEPKTATYARYARDVFGAPIDPPWTYEHLFQHVRNVEPLLFDFNQTIGTTSFDDAVNNCTAYIRADSTQFKPIRMVSDYDGYWNIPMRLRVVNFWIGEPPPV